MSENTSPIQAADIESMRTIAHQAHRLRLADEAIAKQQQIMAGMHQALQAADEKVMGLSQENAQMRAELDALRPIPDEVTHAAG